jgi:hypothetical protein
MSWAGCYSLDLYCDNDGAPAHLWGEFPHQYHHELGSVCRDRARRAGWLMRRDGTSLCPKCSGKKAPVNPTKQ